MDRSTKYQVSLQHRLQVSKRKRTRQTIQHEAHPPPSISTLPPHVSPHPTIPAYLPPLTLPSLTLPATATPNPVPIPLALAATPKTCTPTPTTYVTTITTTKTPYCPTITSTKSVSRNCPILSDCIELQCIIENTTTLPCPAGCCPKKTPTVTATPSCKTTCRAGCATTTYTVTPKC